MDRHIYLVTSDHGLYLSEVTSGHFSIIVNEPLIRNNKTNVIPL